AVWQWLQADSRMRLAQEQRSRYLGTRAENAAKDDDIDFAKSVFDLAVEATETVGNRKLPPGNIAIASELLRRDHLNALLVGDNQALKEAILSPDGDRVLTVSEDGKAVVWDALTGRRMLVLPERARVAAFSPDGAVILSAWDNN